MAMEAQAGTIMCIKKYSTQCTGCNKAAITPHYILTARYSTVTSFFTYTIIVRAHKREALNEGSILSIYVPFIRVHLASGILSGVHLWQC